MVFDRQHRLIAHNQLAFGLRQMLERGRLPGLSDFLNECDASGRVLEVQTSDGAAGPIFELAAMPAGADRILVLGRDVTLERNLRAALVESRQRYKDLVEISSDFAWEVGPDGCFVFVSPKGALGYPAEALVGRHPRECAGSHNPDTCVATFLAELPVNDLEVWLRQADGTEACLLASATPIRTKEGSWAGARGVCRDVTQERLRDAALVRANNRERLLSYIVRTIRDEVEPADMLGAAAAATARALSASGCQIFRMMGDDASFALAAQSGNGGDEDVVLRALEAADHFDGNVSGWHCLATVTRYRHSINGAVCLWRLPDRAGWSDDDRLLIDDVANQVGLANEQIANHERILRLSRTDPLTGLYNRRAFFEELSRRYQRLSRELRPAALIYVDLDNFKLVNDVHGHQTGDQALMAVRDMLLNHTRPIDLVARLGGDEFAIWLEGAEERIAFQRSQELVEASAQLARYSGAPDRPLQFSLGVAIHSAGSPEALDQLIARADEAMYAVKKDGKGTWRAASPPGA